jgi:hypothetical protein
MPKTVNEGFEEFLRRITPNQSERDAAASHRASVESALCDNLDVCRFFETGSFSHGTGISGYSDVDALVSLGHSKPATSQTALNWVRDALSTRFRFTRVKVRRPAVVVEFAQRSEMWEIVPGFIANRGGLNKKVYDIPGPSEGWIDTAPDEHLDYVNEANKMPRRGCAKKLARLMKAWKYYRKVPISSFYLEMRAAKHVSSQNAYVHLDDLCELLESLKSHQLASMNDPRGASGRIHACSSSAKRRDALSRLDQAARRARNARDAHSNNKFGDAFYYLNELFGGNFPARQP